ncbi:MAG: beta-N-acetylhexosaminidase [Chitinophagaceae bacterium]
MTKTKLIPRALLLSIFFLGFTLCSHANSKSDPNLGIIPAPVSVNRLPGHFFLNRQTILQASIVEARKMADQLNKFLDRNFGIILKIRPWEAHPVLPAGSHLIRLSILAGSIPREGYHLLIHQKEMDLEASTASGLFYGLQSLFQLIPEPYLPVPKIFSPLSLPCASIEDYPRFSYRGMNLDCGRHFSPVSFIKLYLDQMAKYKFNTFHWHLTEDQGWRIQIKKYPKLTEVGSIRSETVIGHAHSGKFDGQPYGGFYTQDQIRDIVHYAGERFITVIPEIEMPGHAQAALAAYPFLGCKGGPYQVATDWGVFSHVFCAGKDSTFDFLENVLTEVMALFPSHYIHIGGDECPKTSWKNDSLCQRRIRELHLKNEDGLQSYFIQRIEKFLNAHGRAIIGWDEILEGGLAPNATVMSWRGEEGGIAAARQHHQVIMTPGNWVYFDHGQGDPNREPINIGGYLPLSKVYAYNPIPAGLTPEEQKYIIGSQGNVWTEYMPTPQKVEYMVFPRMLALAEVVWTPNSKKNYANFLDRLPAQLARLDRDHILFRIPKPRGLWDSTTDQTNITLHLEPMVPGTRIFYTLDGSDPTLLSTRYQGAIPIDLSQVNPVTLNLMELTPNGNMSVVYSAKYTYQRALTSMRAPRNSSCWAINIRGVQVGSPNLASLEKRKGEKYSPPQQP